MRLPRFLQSTTARFIALHFVFAALATLLVLGLIWWQTIRVIDAEQKAIVRSEVAGLSAAWTSGGTPALARAIALRLQGAEARDNVFLLTGPGGVVLAGNLSGWPPNAPPPGRWGEIELYRADAAERSRVSGTTFTLPGGARLLVARDATARHAFEATLGRGLIFGLAASAVFSGLSGALLSHYLARRLGEIRDTAGVIGRGGLSERVRLRGSGDEFDRLGTTLNAMLARIEALVGELRMVTDSMAHDLRSPLMRLEAALEEAAGAPAPARHAALARASGEAKSMLRSLTALLDIARAEAGVGRDQFRELDLGALLDDAAALYAPAAEDRGLTLRRTGGSVRAPGHGPLLSQAVSNLIENALRFAPKGSTVMLEILADPPGLAIRDRGPGIPPADRARVLERFVRLDAARSSPGSGLGLSLAAAVARLHDGSLTLGDNGPGLSAELRLGAG
jgi:hypothetical protein